MTHKLQPQATDIEKAVLGAILIEKEAWTLVQDLLTEDDFYLPENQLVYKAATRLSMENHPVDMLTVVEELSRMDKLKAAGGPAYISHLTTLVASTTHVEYHAHIIREKAHARKLIQCASKLVEELYDPSTDIFEAQEKFEKEFTALVTGSGDCLAWDMPRALKETTNRLMEKEQKRLKGEDPEILTGLSTLDEAIGAGWQAPDLAIVGARPSMGKTQFALMFAKSAAQKGKQVLFASIEMTAVQVTGRLLLEDPDIDPKHFRAATLEPEEWQAVEEKVTQLWDLPLYIAGGHQIRQLSHIRSEARRLKRKSGLDLLIIDYLGLIKTSLHFERRYLEVGYITSELKNLAKELDIPIILLSQLSRPVKGHLVKRPQLEDLRESGDIEQDADIVLFLHKPGYYAANAKDGDGKSWKNRGEIIIAKNREGERGQIITYRHDDRYKNISPDKCGE